MAGGPEGKKRSWIKDHPFQSLALAIGALVIAMAIAGNMGVRLRDPKPTAAGPTPTTSATPSVSFTMPDLSGKPCRAAQESLEGSLRDAGVYPTVEEAEGTPGVCGLDHVIYQSDPAAGAKMTWSEGEFVNVALWAMAPEGYRWYSDHPVMPAMVGKPVNIPWYAPNKYGYYKLIDGKADMSLLKESDDSGFWEYGPEVVTTTTPAAGEPLALGQPMTINTQVQRGKWREYPPDTGEGSGGSGGFDIDAYVCVGGRYLHVCMG